MNFINEHINSLNILQLFIDNGCVIYGKSVLDILKENKLDVIKMYLPSDEIIQNIENLKLTLDTCEIKQVTSHKKLWRINDLWILTTTKLPCTTIKDTENMCITNNGVSTFHNRNGLNILNYLRKINNKESFNDPYVNMQIRWITYLLNEGHTIYGSWPSRYITVTQSKEMHRDIDVSANNYKNLHNMINLLIDTDICHLNNKNTQKYTKKSLNINIPTNVGILNFDIHKSSHNMSCDAFYNNLKLTQKFLTVNYQPENINFLSTLILTFKDLLLNNYTLIKPFPERADNMGEFRLIMKPLIFSHTHTINYDYLEKNKKENETINKLTDIITNNKCYKKCNHIQNDNFEIPSTIVIKLGKKFKCIQCIHNHINIQKEINDKKNAILLYAKAMQNENCSEEEDTLSGEE